MYLIIIFIVPARGLVSLVTYGLQMSGLLCAVCDRRVVAAPAPSECRGGWYNSAVVDKNV